MVEACRGERGVRGYQARGARVGAERVMQNGGHTKKRKGLGCFNTAI